MPLRNKGGLREFHQCAHHVTSTKSFNEKFQKLCEQSDRHGMLKILMDIDRVSKWRIKESYREKNDEEAEKLYNESTNGREILAKRVSFLTKALFASNTSSLLFTKILHKRAGCWYAMGAFTRCIKDCDYCSLVIRRKTEEYELDNELIKECNLLKVKCREALKRVERTAANKKPRVDGISGKNKKLPSCSDSLILSRDNTRGRHLVATRNIKNGSVLIVEDAYSFSTDIDALATNCLHCHVSLRHEDNVMIPCDNCQTVAYCSDECRQDSWHKYHRYECKIFDYFYEDSREQRRSHILLAWRTTVASAIDKTTNKLKEEFFNSSGNNHEITDCYDPHDIGTVFALVTHCPDSPSIVNLARSLTSIFIAKCLDLALSTIHTGISTRELLLLVAVGTLFHIQAIDCNAYEIVDNARDESTKIWEPRNVGGAIYPTVSLVNHSCYPNVVRHSYPGGKVVVRALRFIPKGNEILDCYGPHFVSDSAPARRRYLHDKYYFSCTCEACSNNYQLPDEDAFKCSCGYRLKSSRCTNCKRRIDVKKLEARLAKSVEIRVNAIGSMLDGNYADVLPGLLEHGTLIDKILAEPSREAIKTQQSIVQCYNSFASVCPSDYNGE